MKLFRVPGSVLFAFIAVWFPFTQAAADGGYLSVESVAVSADQRAIITKNGNRISMTFSTGYTGEGEDFGWIIPDCILRGLFPRRHRGAHRRRTSGY
jgi:hypothetical protein